MPFFSPLANVTGKNAYSLFEIRLDDDFIVFRGDTYNSAAQVVKGTVVLCLSALLKIEDVHLQLIGTERIHWTDTRITPTGVANSKVDRTNIFYTHKWDPFVGGNSVGGSGSRSSSSRSITLDEGNYEYPFEITLPGDTCESVEGFSEASIIYHLKATVARGKLAYDFHARKRLRVIRTLESTALEFLHTMSVENIWPNKVEYSLMTPQKAVVFGSVIPLEARLTPLAKGLEIHEIVCKLVETSEVTLKTSQGFLLREHKKEREVKSWTVPVSREEHWQNMIEDTGQEGWVLSALLDLPRKLGKCLQDTDVHGIKIRHKLKLTVALHNSDGHTSELRASLPLMIFISPNMPLDEDGNLVQQAPTNPEHRLTNVAPPGYGEHVLDQLYDEVDMTGLVSGMQTPALQSGVNSPVYGLSRAGSSENLAALSSSHTGIAASALSSRLQNVSIDDRPRRNESYSSLSAAAMPGNLSHAATARRNAASQQSSPNNSPPLSRSHSAEHSDTDTPQYVELENLSRVPSYATAVRTPSRPSSTIDGVAVPHYEAAMNTNSASPIPRTLDAHGPLSSIAEGGTFDERDAAVPSRQGDLERLNRRSQGTNSASASHSQHATGVQIMQAQARVS